MKRDIFNYLGEKLGQIEFPDGTSIDVINAKLAEYATPPKSPEEMAAEFLEMSVKQRKQYAEDLLERFKRKNITEGINASQGLWMHQRMRANEVSFGGRTYTIDILNLAISGDIEIACISLINTVPDDMSQPYHWLSSARINWLVSDMKSFLGWA